MHFRASTYSGTHKSEPGPLGVCVQISEHRKKSNDFASLTLLILIRNWLFCYQPVTVRVSK